MPNLNPEEAAITAFFSNPEFDLQAGLILWNKLREDWAWVKDAEMMARKAIFHKTWPQWRVGVNNYPLNNGFVLKGTGKINYSLDKAMFPEVSNGLKSMGLSIDPFLAVSYDLAVGPYNAVLKDPQQNPTVGTILRKMITSSEGAPTLEITKSKTK